MTEYVVAEEGELADGEHLVVQLEGREIGVFFTDGVYRAYLNWCPHQGGPVCEGRVTGTQTSCFDRETLDVAVKWDREGEILNCPWHGWEFDVNSGECLSRPKVKLPEYPVRVEDGTIIVDL
ncbi:Rieske (2Fe-2S) protein [Halomarina halobia]|uniref:Rieske (2Fe-2S) protein n=1 Tax=Halomarina halobia TaxID=3033386 RepID=A0ABD6AEB3_9EURY|nr:Rieske (2Fe-2S) protein [Halomarina sp. PSR21]